jgi:hypothetical protein
MVYAADRSQGDQANKKRILDQILALFAAHQPQEFHAQSQGQVGHSVISHWFNDVQDNGQIFPFLALRQLSITLPRRLRHYRRYIDTAFQLHHFQFGPVGQFRTNHPSAVQRFRKWRIRIQASQVVATPRSDDPEHHFDWK